MTKIKYTTIEIACFHLFRRNKHSWNASTSCYNSYLAHSFEANYRYKDQKYQYDCVNRYLNKNILKLYPQSMELGKGILENNFMIYSP